MKKRERNLIVTAVAVWVVVVGLFVLRPTDTQYFPPDAELRYFPEFLVAMNEPSLFARRGDEGAEAYRFLLLRTWHKPIAVRLWRDSSGVLLRVVKTNGRGGFEPGVVEFDKTLRVKDADIAECRRLIEEIPFWESWDDNWNVMPLDGSAWVLEGLSEGRYHVMMRWSPVRDTAERRLVPFVATAQHLLKQSGIEIDEADDF